MSAGAIRSRACCGAVVALLWSMLAPLAAAKGGGGDEVRVSGRCSAGASSTLRLRGHDGAIRLEFELRRRHAGELWRVVVVQERRVVARTSLHTKRSGGALRARRTLTDLDGPDRVTVRASGPRGLTCEAAATLRA